jgi:hypothetical protein
MIVVELGQDYERTIDELIAIRDGDMCEDQEMWEAYCDACDELVKRQLVRDFTLDLQDELNDAGLVVVPADAWEHLLQYDGEPR